MKWFRLYSSVLHDPKVQMLPADVFKGWINLLCLANEAEPRGILPDVDTIAWALHLTRNEAVTLLETLLQHSLIDTSALHHDAYTPHNWGNRQANSDDVNTRVRTWRQAQRQANPGPEPEAATRNVTRNNVVTPPEESKKRGDREREKRTRTRTREGNGVSAPTGATADAAPGSLSQESQKQKPEPDPLHAAFVAKLGAQPRTGSERRKWRAGLDELRETGITAEDVPRLVDQFRLKFGANIPCTPATIASNYSQLGVPHVLRPTGTAGTSEPGHRASSPYSPVDIARRRAALQELGIPVPELPPDIAQAVAQVNANSHRPPADPDKS